MNERPLTHVLNRLAEEGMPADLDLRAAVHRQLEMSHTQRKGVFSMNASFGQLRRVAAVIGVAVCLLTAAVWCRPSSPR